MYVYWEGLVSVYLMCQAFNYRFLWSTPTLVCFGTSRVSDRQYCTPPARQHSTGRLQPSKLAFDIRELCFAQCWVRGLIISIFMHTNWESWGTWCLNWLCNVSCQWVHQLLRQKKSHFYLSAKCQKTDALFQSLKHWLTFESFILCIDEP